MTETDPREFLDRFPTEELAARGVLNGGTRLLNNRSVAPVIALMTEHGVTRLASASRNWFLDVSGEFRNPRSTEATSGNVEALQKPGERLQRAKHLDQSPLREVARCRRGRGW